MKPAPINIAQQIGNEVLITGPIIGIALNIPINGLKFPHTKPPAIAPTIIPATIPIRPIIIVSFFAYKHFSVQSEQNI